MTHTFIVPELKLQAPHLGKLQEIYILDIDWLRVPHRAPRDIEHLVDDCSEGPRRFLFLDPNL
jgi:hypothetical protein